MSPLLSNILSIDLLFIMTDTDVAVYVDKNTLYVHAEIIDKAIDLLEKKGNTLFKCFKDNLSQENADNCHLLVSSSSFIRMANFIVNFEDHILQFALVFL